MKVSAQGTSRPSHRHRHRRKGGVTRPGQPSVRLVLVVYNEPKEEAPGVPRPLGRLKGLIKVPTDKGWAAMDKELEALMVPAPLTTDGAV